MNSLRLLLLANVAAILVSSGALADEKPVNKETARADIPIFGNQRNEPSSLSNYQRKQASVAELRHSRALLKADQRRARMEHNAWIGHEPLRPNWNAVPYSRSRYERHAIYVPFYFYR